MKKLFAFFATVVLLSNCTLFGGSSTPTIKEGEKPTEKQYETYSADMHKVWSEKILDMTPEINIPKKSENDFNLKANFSIPATGNVKINASSMATNDLSDEKNPESDTKFTLTLNLEPDSENMYSGMPQMDLDTELMFKMVKQKMFLSLAKLNVSMQDVPMDTYEAIIAPFLGNWYGGTYDDIENALKAKGVPTDMFNFPQMKEGLSPSEMLDIKGPLSEMLAQVHIWKLKETLPAKDGMVLFKVELDREKAKKSGEAMMNFAKEVAFKNANMPEYMKSQMERDFQDGKNEFDNFIDNLSIEGTLAILQKNSEYFTFIGDVTYEGETGKVSVKWLEKEKMLSITDPGDEEPAFLAKMTTEGKEDTFSLESPKMKEVLVTGKKSPTMFQMTVYNPDRMDQKVALFNVDLIRDKDDYTGKITIPDANAVLDIQKLTLNINNFKLQTSVDVGGQKMGDVDLSWNTKEVKSVSISEPSNYESFEKFVEQVEVAMMSLMGLMGGMNDPYMMDDYEYNDLDFDPGMFEEDFEPIEPGMLEEDFDPSMFEDDFEMQ